MLFFILIFKNMLFMNRITFWVIYMNPEVIFLLDVCQLSKCYGNRYAVNKLTFRVEQGEIFAFFGKNGAGKSTTMKLLATLLEPDEGSFSLEDSSFPEEIRKKTGIVFQENTLDDSLTVLENLKFRGMLYPSSSQPLEEKIYKIAQDLSFVSYLSHDFKTLSGGQKRIVQIARALLGDPRLLILDEPTVGLDPQMRKRLWDILISLKNKRQITVFFSSHYMEEAKICDKLCIIDQGKIQMIGTPKQLTALYGQYHLTLTEDGQHFTFEPSSPQDAIRMLQQHSGMESFEFRADTLDDIFVKITGNNREVCL